MPEGTTAYEIVGARWFDGTAFVDRTMYVVGETLYVRRPKRVDTVIDLEGAYVIPPLAEAHQHDIEFPEPFDSVSAAYLRAGVYYVPVQSDVPDFAKELKERTATPTTVDAIWAHGTITGARGHPVYLYETALRDEYEAALGQLPEGWFAGRSYHIVTDSATLDAAWTRLLADDPDFVKVVFS